MSIQELIAYASCPLIRSFRKWLMEREYKQNQRDLAVIARQIENDLAAQRELHARQAILKIHIFVS